MDQLTNLMKSTTNRLVLLTVIISFAHLIIFGNNDYSGFELFNWKTSGFKPWQLLSHMFLHADELHLAFNMIALWSFGNILEKTWGKDKFLVFYLVCGIGSAIFSQLVDTYLYSKIFYGATVGASGGVYGLLTAFALVYPNFKITLLFLPVPIAAKYFVPVLLLIDLTAGVTGFSIFGANIAHFAHIGGAVVGLMLAKFWLN